MMVVRHFKRPNNVICHQSLISSDQFDAFAISKFLYINIYLKKFTKLSVWHVSLIFKNVCLALMVWSWEQFKDSGGR